MKNYTTPENSALCIKGRKKAILTCVKFVARAKREWRSHLSKSLEARDLHDTFGQSHLGNSEFISGFIGNKQAIH